MTNTDPPRRERPFDREVEKEWIAARAPAIRALDALQARSSALPVRARIEVNRRANEGEDYETVLAEVEARHAAGEQFRLPSS